LDTKVLWRIKRNHAQAGKGLMKSTAGFARRRQDHSYVKRSHW